MGIIKDLFNNILLENNIDKKLDELFILKNIIKDSGDDCSVFANIEFYLNRVAFHPISHKEIKFINSEFENTITLYSKVYNEKETYLIYKYCYDYIQSVIEGEKFYEKVHDFTTICDKEVLNYTSKLDLTECMKKFFYCNKTKKLIHGYRYHGVDNFMYSEKFKNIETCGGASRCDFCSERSDIRRLLRMYYNYYKKTDIFLNLNTVILKEAGIYVPFEFPINDITVSTTLKKLPTIDDVKKSIYKQHFQTKSNIYYTIFIKFMMATKELNPEEKFYFTMFINIQKILNNEIIPSCEFDYNLLDTDQKLIYSYYNFIDINKPVGVDECNKLYSYIKFNNVKFRYDKTIKYEINSDMMRFDEKLDCKDNDELFKVHIYYLIVNCIANKYKAKFCEFVNDYKNVISILTCQGNNKEIAYKYQQIILLKVAIIYFKNEKITELKEVVSLMNDEFCIGKICNITGILYHDLYIKPATSIHEKLHEERFRCPITSDTFTDPVIAADGFTYDRPVMVEYLKTNDISPITRQKLQSKTLYPNKLLRFEIQEITGEILNCADDFEPEDEDIGYYLEPDM